MRCIRYKPSADSFVVAMLDGGAVTAGAWSTREAQQGATVAVSIVDYFFVLFFVLFLIICLLLTHRSASTPNCAACTQIMYGATLYRNRINSLPNGAIRQSGLRS